MAPAAAILAAVEGWVLTSAGQPVEHARVALVDGSAELFTDPKGEFRFASVEPPAEIDVSHPRFETRRLTLSGAGPAEIRLKPKQEIYEEIAVSANRGEQGFSPVSVASAVLDPTQAVTPPTTLTELVAEIPGVAENGQGGIFQTYSIRGVSRQRVLTLLSGMRIVSERRAGVSASFLDPLLVRSVDILRGGSSTYYGSGALGGVVQLFPRQFEGWSVQMGYESQGNENYQVLGWGGGRGWSLGLARRDAGNGETPGGGELNSAFGQSSATLQKRWSAKGYDLRFEAVASAGRDIAKASTDAPERTTVYPEENHLLLRFAVRSPADWTLEVWVHPNDLETRVTQADVERTDLSNEAFDLGVNWQKQLPLGPGSSARLGLDYFGRRGVEAVEVARHASDRVITQQTTLDDAREDEAGAYGVVEWNKGRAVLLAGGRIVWQSQANGDRPAAEDTAVSAFAGLVLPVGSGFELAANLGSGLRFPALSERFFSGVTGRGLVEGNPGLDPERSLTTDVGLRWYGNRLFLAGYVFRNEIDDYIERVETATDLLTFVNLLEGAIQGVELEGHYRFDSRWSLSFGGHLLEGRSEASEPLVDVPADRFYLGGDWQAGRWRWQGRWEERWEKTDFGSGEKPIPSASLLSAALHFDWRKGLSFSLGGRNLLDEAYFNSADRKVPLAPGRSLAIGLSWRSGSG
jgi:iron complex outermembrane receptor protein